MREAFGEMDGRLSHKIFSSNGGIPSSTNTIELQRIQLVGEAVFLVGIFGKESPYLLLRYFTIWSRLPWVEIEFLRRKRKILYLTA